MNNKEKIRLNDSYIRTIKKLAKKYFDTDDVRIFGSRTDPKQKGGDIDIYIRTNKTQNILRSKIAFLRDFELELGEQKIDLVVQAGNVNKKIFDIAKREGIRL